MKSKQLQWMVAGAVSLMLQSCAIPLITSKQAETTLPATYQETVQPAANSASVNWKDFFDDPHLVALMDVAVANNKEINIMAQRISVAQNEIQARKGEYLPFVGIGASADKEKVGKYTRNGAVEENLDIKDGRSNPRFLGNYQFGLVASWELDVWKKLRNATKVAVMEYMATIEGKNFLVTNLVAEVAHAYYELIALDNELQTLDQNIAIQQNALSVVKELQQYARANSLAVKRFDAEVKKNQSRQYVLKQQIVETENRINYLLGRTPQTIARNSDNFMSMQPKIVQTGIPSELLANRPDIRQAELELSAAKLNIDVAKANFYPSFAIRGGLGFQAFDPKYLLNIPASVMASFGGELVAPLINRNAIEAQYKSANAMQIEAAFDYEKTIINAYMEVANQISNIDNLDKSYQLKNNQVEQLTQSIDVANQLFKAARADYMEVLLTQRDALDAKMELIETKQQQISAVVNLYRSLGGGWKEDSTPVTDQKK
ncbi:TolC family protein [Methylophilus aquaticus]|uniref:Efflux transporter outer membrane subunit n=1 Tax=Methylophilus aquaticus TaxID=1971610 RepID=A0ABT9JTC7_9PROT|nr:efflux transporter outer membrane subunit [Methylophilus aquaticus]MDP8567827.1 efflux transporter outer membrane subunit [Methylophilus aquaticus]